MPSHKFINRLSQESSAFLLRHAYDPVDWYPWGEEAFSASKASNKPIFLSIGYEASQQSKEMQMEIFSNFEIAARLNSEFICILIDKDDHPCTADLYFEFAHAFFLDNLDWPLNFALSPSLHPIFVAKCLPLISTNGEVGIEEFLTKVTKIWSESPDILNKETAFLIEELTQKVLSRGDTFPKQSFLLQYKENLFPHVDPLYGGETETPKIINTSQLKLLLYWLADTHDDRSVMYVTKTLDRAFYGSIRDHISGGFFNSCYDPSWKEPFLEKRLGENAYLLEIYLQAWKVFKDPNYKFVVEQALDHFLSHYPLEKEGYQSYESDLSSSGACYFLSVKDLTSVLGSEKAKLVGPYLGIFSKKGDDFSKIPYVENSIKEYCQANDLAPDEFLNELKLATQTLNKAKSLQYKFHKFINWILIDNAYFAATLLHAGLALSRLEYINAGIDLLEALWKNFWNGIKLKHLIASGNEGKESTFTDYAVLVYAMLHAYELGFGEVYLERAEQLTFAAHNLFKKEGGAFYSSEAGHQHLLYQQCELPDERLPSGNALHSENLYRLYQLTGDLDYLHGCEDILKTVQPLMEVYPLGYSHHFYTLWRIKTDKSIQLVLQADSNLEEQRKLQIMLSKKFMPHVSIKWDRSGGKESSKQAMNIVKFGSQGVEAFPQEDLESVIGRI